MSFSDVPPKIIERFGQTEFLLMFTSNFVVVTERRDDDGAFSRVFAKWESVFRGLLGLGKGGCFGDYVFCWLWFYLCAKMELPRLLMCVRVLYIFFFTYDAHYLHKYKEAKGHAFVHFT